MRRVLEFFEWKSAWWLEQWHRCNDKHATVLSGLAAYAEKQATIYCRLAAKFAGMWLLFLKSRGIYPDWWSRYVDCQAVTCDKNLSEDSSTDSNAEDSGSE